MHHAPSPYQLPPHNAILMCEKSVIDGLHPMIILKQKSFVYKPKLVGCYTPNDISYTKLMCLFVGSEFSRSHHKLRTPLNAFWTFTIGVSEPVQVFYPRENLALLAITRRKFLPFYSTVRLYWTFSNDTKPTESITKRNVDFPTMPSHP